MRKKEDQFLKERVATLDLESTRTLRQKQTKKRMTKAKLLRQVSTVSANDPHELYGMASQ